MAHCISCEKNTDKYVNSKPNQNLHLKPKRTKELEIWFEKFNQKNLLESYFVICCYPNNIDFCYCLISNKLDDDLTSDSLVYHENIYIISATPERI